MKYKIFYSLIMFSLEKNDLICSKDDIILNEFIPKDIILVNIYLPKVDGNTTYEDFMKTLIQMNT